MPRSRKDKEHLFVKVTVSIPRKLRQAARNEQTNRKLAFSKIVSEALTERYITKLNQTEPVNV